MQFHFSSKINDIFTQCMSRHYTLYSLKIHIRLFKNMCKCVIGLHVDMNLQPCAQNLCATRLILPHVYRWNLYGSQKCRKNHVLTNHVPAAWERYRWQSISGAIGSYNDLFRHKKEGVRDVVNNWSVAANKWDVSSIPVTNGQCRNFSELINRRR